MNRIVWRWWWGCAGVEGVAAEAAGVVAEAAGAEGAIDRSTTDCRLPYYNTNRRPIYSVDYTHAYLSIGCHTSRQFCCYIT